MQYPTLEQVNSASRETLATWSRFLPSPGMSEINSSPEKFQNRLEKDAIIINRIIERFKEVGGFTPEISKKIGWDP